MRLLLFFSLMTTLFSCQESKTECDEWNDMYNILSGEFNRDLNYYSSRIEEQLLSVSGDSIKYSKAQVFHDIVAEYDQFLKDMVVNLKDTPENPFFINESTSELGAAYLVKNMNCREMLNELIQDEALNKYMLDMLREDSPSNIYGESIEHIEYYFKGISNQGILAFLLNKRRSLLAIETQYLINLQKK